MSFSWKCPFCNQHATITDNNLDSYTWEFYQGSKYGKQKLALIAIGCPNEDCGEYTLQANLTHYRHIKNMGYQQDGATTGWQLIPKSPAKVFPDYTPKAIRDDYEESCLISNLSPKASATLARRCLQGIIRDFWDIKKDRLYDEIAALEGKLDPLTWEAIDAVRKIGNIGAHMKKDINSIIDVDPGEALKLIGLIEILIEDWYIARHEKQKHLEKIVELAKKKEEVKSHPKETDKQ